MGIAPSSNASNFHRVNALHRQRYVDVAEAESRVPASQLEAEIAAFDAAHGKPLSLFDRIRREERPIALAAEFKRASPSKGVWREAR